jgi:hypothetical protein
MYIFYFSHLSMTTLICVKAIIIIIIIRWRYPCYRPWRPLGLREVEAPTLFKQTANRWRQGCQSYASAALYPQICFLRFLALISVRLWLDPRAIVRREGLGKLEKKNPPHWDAIPRPSVLQHSASTNTLSRVPNNNINSIKFFIIYVLSQRL